MVLIAVRFSNSEEPDTHLTQSIVETQYLLSYPDDTIQYTHVSEDAQSAWLEIKDADAIGLMRTFGNGYAVRRVEPKAIRRYNRDEHALTIRLRDFGLPFVTLTTAIDELENRVSLVKTQTEEANTV